MSLTEHDEVAFKIDNYSVSKTKTLPPRAYISRVSARYDEHFVLLELFSVFSAAIRCIKIKSAEEKERKTYFYGGTVCSSPVTCTVQSDWGRKILGYNCKFKSKSCTHRVAYVKKKCSSKFQKLN